MVITYILQMIESVNIKKKLELTVLPKSTTCFYFIYRHIVKEKYPIYIFQMQTCEEKID